MLPSSLIFQKKKKKKRKKIQNQVYGLKNTMDRK